MADRTGQRIDDYQLLRLLGQGTFGEVYLAQHLYKHTLVAIKILTMQVSDEVLEDFLREARTLFLLNHPHIVPLLDFGSEKKEPFLVIQYAPNGTLRQRHRTGERVPLDMVNSYVQQVASALQYAHDQRLIHCDVKPQNMLLNQDGQVLLSDFGVAAIAHSDRSFTTQQMAGTVAYVAPEQIQGKPRPASDQYALGICAYEWLCGVRPFTGPAWELMSQHISTPPARLRTHIPDLPEAVEEVVLHALAKDPQERFASVTAFATAMQQASQPAPLYFTGKDISKSQEHRTPSWPRSELVSPASEEESAPSVPKEAHSSPSLSEPAASALDAPTVAAPDTGGRRSGLQQASSVDAFPAQPSKIVIPNPPTPAPFPEEYPAIQPALLAPSDSMPTTEPSQPPPLLNPRGADAERLTNPSVGAARARHGWSKGQLLVLGAIILIVLASALTPALIIHNQNNVSLMETETAIVHSQAIQTAQADAATAAYQNWVNTNGVMFGFDPAHTHWNNVEQIISPDNLSHLRVLWTYGMSNVISSAPAVANGIVYVSAYDGNLYAFDASCRAACQPLWSYKVGSDVTSSPAVANGIVYIGSDDHKLYAFDASCRAACQPLWSYTTGAPIYSSPTVANGIVYIGSDDHKLYAFDASCRVACQPLWSYKTSGGIDSSPAVANGIVYIGTFGEKLYAFDASCRRSCQPLWSYKTDGGIDSSPAVASGIVYIGSDDDRLYAFDAGCRSSCQPLWSYATGKRIRSSPAVANGIVYVGSDDDRLYAFDAGCRSACQPLWSYATGNTVDSSPTVANGVVYVGSNDGKLYAFSANCQGSSCRPLWSYKTNGGIFSSPTVANGILYVGSGNRNLYAFGL